MKMLYSHTTRGRSLMFTIILLIVGLYEWLAITLFVILTWLASQSIQIIIDDVETFAPALHQTYDQRLKKWKRSYCLISNFVLEVKRFFELVLLQYITIQFFHTFIELALTMFTALWHPEQKSIHFFTTKIIRSMLQFLVIAMGTRPMKIKVRFVLTNTIPWHQPYFDYCYYPKAQVLVEKLAKRRYFNNTIEQKVKFLLSFQPTVNDNNKLRSHRSSFFRLVKSTSSSVTSSEDRYKSICSECWKLVLG